MPDEDTNTTKQGEESFQKRLGLVMALIATIFSITSWAASTYSSAQSGAVQKSAYMHDWYNAKGIKQNLAEAQRDLIQALLDSETIRPEKRAVLQESIEVSSANVARYKREKDEMTRGSVAVGKDNWVQEVDGKLGLIQGTKELDQKVASLTPAIERFHLSYLFFQLSLFSGSVSLMSHDSRMRYALFWILSLLGFIGTVLATSAWISASAVGN